MKKKLMIGLSILIATGSIGIASAAAASSESKAISKYRNMQEQEVKEALKKLDKKELLQEVNDLSKDVNQTELTTFALEIIERSNEFEYGELLNEMRNDDNTESFGQLMVDTYIYKSISKDEKGNFHKKSEDLKELLKDSSVDESIKSKIIMDSAMDNSDIPLLEEFIVNSDDEISVSSFKKLSIIDANAAKDQAENVLKK